MALDRYRSGAPLPAVIENAPQLFRGLEVYLQAFFDLDSERNHGMGAMAIPWSSIVKYAEFQRMDDDQTQDLLYFVRAMDSWNLDRIVKDQKRERPKTSKSGRK